MEIHVFLIHNVPLKYVQDIIFALKNHFVTRKLLIMRLGTTFAMGSLVDLEKMTAPHYFNALVVVAV
jgi:hypothetical protein